MLTNQDQQFLLKLARITLEGKESDIADIPLALLEKGATFVSLYKENELIKSVGGLHPSKELFQDVIANVHAFDIKDLNNIKIEISLLKNYKKIISETQEELLSQITKDVHGIVIEKDKKMATLLPLAWKKIQDKEEFLNQICYKLQLEKDSWKINANIFTYEAETFREN